MKIRVNSDNITITEIYNESMLEFVKSIVRQSECSYKAEDNFTKGIVKGSKEQLNKFINCWNEA